MDSQEIETKTTDSGLLADEIEIEPKLPQNPAGKPGLGGLALIPEVIGAIVGADGFCSIYNFPGAGLCIGDPNVPKEERDEKTGYGAMPAWCLINPDWNFCPGVVNPVDPETNVPLSGPLCFDPNWHKVQCDFDGDDKICRERGLNDKNQLVSAGSYYAPCNNLVQCYTVDGIPINCNLGKEISAIGVNGWVNNNSTLDGNCVLQSSTIQPDGNYFLKSKCYIRGIVLNDNNDPFSKGYSFDKYMRLVDSNTRLPITNDDFEGGYPINAVYPPEPEPDPEPVKPPFDPGPNPFDPDLPESTEECANIICECIALVVNALGAVNNTILKVDNTLLGMVDQLDNLIDKVPTSSESLPVDLDPINSKLDDILDAINDISVEIVKEAGTNFWDVLGGAFGDIFDLIEFLIDKVIYLVIPEDTESINQAFDQLNGLIVQKFQPVDQVKTAINQSLNVEKQEFEDISVILPEYGEVKFFETEFLMMALPQIQRVMSAIMILLTAIYAYRKVSSEMIK